MVPCGRSHSHGGLAESDIVLSYRANDGDKQRPTRSATIPRGCRAICEDRLLESLKPGGGGGNQSLHGFGHWTLRSRSFSVNQIKDYSLELTQWCETISDVNPRKLNFNLGL